MCTQGAARRFGSAAEIPGSSVSGDEAADFLLHLAGQKEAALLKARHMDIHLRGLSEYCVRVKPPRQHPHGYAGLRDDRVKPVEAWDAWGL